VLKPIKLVTDTIDTTDIDLLIKWLQTYPRLTKGKITIQFEHKWSEWMGRKYSLFCNSGSSANLLMLAALLEGDYISPGAQVVVPALSWATDLAPVMQLGLKPILCDINIQDLSVDLDYLEDIFKNSRPSVLILVSVLGLVPQMDRILDLCQQYNVVLLEDVCESLGSTFNQKKLGTFGLMSSFSTYFGHHISTIEGGIVTTDDRKLINILRSLRSHGWERDLDKDVQTTLRDEYEIDEFSALYTFYYAGFNLRSTDLQAFIGLGQLDKLDQICFIRNKNYFLYNKFIKNDYWSPPISLKHFVSNFAFPIIHPNKKEIVEKLQESKIEVRPLICGSLGSQPFYVKKYGPIELPNASHIDKYGCYIPNHPGLTDDQIKNISDIINMEIKE